MTETVLPLEYKRVTVTLSGVSSGMRMLKFQVRVACDAVRVLMLMLKGMAGSTVQRDTGLGITNADLHQPI